MTDAGSSDGVVSENLNSERNSEQNTRPSADSR